MNGDHAFQLLYESVGGDNGTERWLRSICSGGLSTSFVTGVDFMVNTIAYYSNGKSNAGKSIWDMGLEVHKSLKKALALMPRLTCIVNVDQTGIVSQVVRQRKISMRQSALVCMN